MHFVPDGQGDSSQVRSAWVSIQKDRRPGGTVDVIGGTVDVIGGTVDVIGGTVDVIFSPRDIVITSSCLAPNLSRDPFNRPAGTGLVFS
jgi:hypothetical protein